MRDTEIREFLRLRLRAMISGDTNAFILEEFGLCQHEARIDLAVLNGEFVGFEIKSDSDSLSRLARQEAVYSRILDRVILVVGQTHIERATTIVPAWWGIWQARTTGLDMELVEVRPAGLNPALDCSALVRLLWRTESIEILKRHQIEKGVLSKPRKLLWQRLTEHLTSFELRSTVHEMLKKRLSLQQTVQPELNDGWSPLPAT